MSNPGHIAGRVALAVSALAALLAALPPSTASAGPAPASRLATTGNDSEIVNAVPITTQPHVNERVAMSVGPDQLGQIGSGDRLWASGEVQVSTTCVAPGPRCIGRP